MRFPVSLYYQLPYICITLHLDNLIFCYSDVLHVYFEHTLGVHVLVVVEDLEIMNHELATFC